MFNSPTLDVAIGLAMIFLLLSLLVSAVCEMLSGFFKWRAANLWDGIEQLLQSKDARNALYNHPLIRGLAPTGTSAPTPPTTQAANAPPDGTIASLGKRLTRAIWVSADVDGGKIPSYIPSRTFALALIEVLREPHEVADHVRQGFDALIGNATQNPFGYVDAVKKQLDTFAADASLGQGVRDAITKLRDRIFASPSEALVTSLKASVKSVTEPLRTSNPNAVAAVTQWLDAAPAADCPTLRQSLAAAIAQVAPGDATADARKALDGILSQFSVGTPEQIAGQLQTFVDKAGDVRHALDNADGKLKDLARSLSPLLDDAAGDVDHFRRNVEVWFNNGMDRVAGWYKRHTTAWQAVIGFILAVALNVDALQIVRTLYQRSRASPEHRLAGSSLRKRTAPVARTAEPRFLQRSGTGREGREREPLGRGDCARRHALRENRIPRGRSESNGSRRGAVGVSRPQRQRTSGLVEMGQQARSGGHGGLEHGHGVRTAQHDRQERERRDVSGDRRRRARARRRERSRAADGRRPVRFAAHEDRHAGVADRLARLQ